MEDTQQENMLASSYTNTKTKTENDAPLTAKPDFGVKTRFKLRKSSAKFLEGGPCPRRERSPAAEATDADATAAPVFPASFTGLGRGF